MINVPIYGDQSWRSQAACPGNASLFFPESEREGAVSRVRTVDINRALAICARCSVREQCLDWALTLRPSQLFNGQVLGGKWWSGAVNGTRAVQRLAALRQERQSQRSNRQRVAA